LFLAFVVAAMTMVIIYRRKNKLSYLVSTSNQGMYKIFLVSSFGSPIMTAVFLLPYLGAHSYGGYNIGVLREFSDTMRISVILFPIGSMLLSSISIALGIIFSFDNKRSPKLLVLIVVAAISGVVSYNMLPTVV